MIVRNCFCVHDNLEEDAAEAIGRCTEEQLRRRTCVCLPFSGASLMGREEYELEHSPSFLGSTGLFGLRGKPVVGRRIKSGALSVDPHPRQVNQHVCKTTRAHGFKMAPVEDNLLRLLL